MTDRDTLHGAIVCVTGAAGFIGTNLCRALFDDGATVHAIIRPSTDPFRLADVAHQMRIHRLDLRDGAAVHSAIRQIQPRVIFHAAVHSPYLRSDPVAALIADNVLATANLIDALAESGGRLIHLGSSMEYGPAPRAHVETDRLLPMAQHGATKAAATLLVTQQARSGLLDGATLRLFSVYGPWEPEHRLVPTAIRAALAGSTLPLTRPGLRRDYVFVSDVVEACLLAASNADVRGEVINIGSGQETTNEAMVEEIANALGCAINTSPGAYSPHPTDTEHWVADISLARKLIGWSPRHSIREGIEKTVEWSRPRFKARTAAGGEALMT